MKAKFVNEESGLYNDQKLSKLLNDLRADGPVGDDEAFEIAQMLLDEEPGLESFIRYSQRVEDPVGWLADRI